MKNTEKKKIVARQYFALISCGRSRKKPHENKSSLNVSSKYFTFTLVALCIKHFHVTCVMQYLYTVLGFLLFGRRCDTNKIIKYLLWSTSIRLGASVRYGIETSKAVLGVVLPWKYIIIMRMATEGTPPPPRNCPSLYTYACSKERIMQQQSE